jgi:hypothetical protein
MNLAKDGIRHLTAKLTYDSKRRLRRVRVRVRYQDSNGKRTHICTTAEGTADFLFSRFSKEAWASTRWCQNLVAVWPAKPRV